MRRSYLHNPEAYLDEKGVAHVLMPEHQEGIGGPRVSRMVEALGISRKQAEHLRQRMRDDDSIEDILVEANRLCRGKGHFYYPGAADTPEQPDGIAFVDRGDLGRETLIYDHRDGRFVLNAVGPSVARQRERFAKRNPRPASETLYVVDTSPSGKVVTIRDATLDEIRFGDAMPYDQAVYWASVFAAETSGARVVDTSSHAKNP
jgi:hypothetical protein